MDASDGNRYATDAIKNVFSQGSVAFVENLVASTDFSSVLLREISVVFIKWLHLEYLRLPVYRMEEQLEFLSLHSPESEHVSEFGSSGPDI